MIILSYASKNPDRLAELRAGIAKLIPDGSYELRIAATEDEAIAMISDAEVMLSHNITPEVFAASKNLKWIHRTDAGIEKTLFPALVESKVVVTNTRGIHARPMAEWTLGMLIHIAQRFDQSELWRRDRDWQSHKKVMTTERLSLADMRALIIGWGEVAKPIGEILTRHGLHCEAVATTARAAEISVHASAELPNLLGSFDIVIVTLPHTASTEKLCNAQFFSKMKPGSIFVNLARGKVVDEPALISALQNGPLYFAALDVFRDEPLPADSPFFELPNVVMTPHTSGNFPAYTERVHELFLENLRRYLVGEPLKFVVDKSRGY